MVTRKTPAARIALVAAFVLALVLVPAALAGKGGKPGGGGSTGGSSSISGPVMITDTGTLGVSSGDTVTFNVSTTATTTPWVNLQCFQNGALVYSGWKGFWVGSIDPTWNFGLASTAWQSGAADCTANLDMNTRQGMAKLASTSFHVDA
jgi:hypothetical protein